jgi:regulator of RNase E activity RraA
MPASAEPQSLLTTLRTRLFTAVVGDVMDTLGLRHQFLPPEIRALTPRMVIAGRAMPVLESDLPEDSDGEDFGLMFRALDSLKVDEIYVCAGASPTYALWGGLMSTRAMKLGAAGAVMDGFHRDTREILALGFPVFSRGAYAQDQKLRGKVTDFAVPAMFPNGAMVSPGDIVFGDVDGVVAIPKDVAADVVRLAVEKVDGENTVRRMIEAGGTSEEAFATTGIM